MNKEAAPKKNPLYGKKQPLMRNGEPPPKPREFNTATDVWLVIWESDGEYQCAVFASEQLALDSYPEFAGIAPTKHGERHTGGHPHVGLLRRPIESGN